MFIISSISTNIAVKSHKNKINSAEHGREIHCSEPKVLTDFFMTKGQQDHTNYQKSIRKTQSRKLTSRTTAEAAGAIPGAEGTVEQKERWPKGPDCQTTICCGQPLPAAQRSDRRVNTPSLSHSNTEDSHPQAEAKTKKPWKTLRHPPRKGSSGAAELHSAP